jgi:uncharacterized Ntn-hydrolase superfamily protein
MTYSIVARDPDSGEIGAAVATGWPAVGAVVPWVEPGVGAVATQASTNIDLGPLGLDLLRAGRSAAEAVESLVDADDGRDRRQLGIVDARGRSAGFTGSTCVGAAAHACAADASAQGNMLARPGIPDAMLDAFSAAVGDLAERLLAALRIADAAGGDARGLHSAALVVAPGGLPERPWARRFDLRVDEASSPLDELARVLRVARAYEALGSGLQAAREGRIDEGLRGTTVARERAPDDGHIALWHGVLLLANGQEGAARSLLVSTIHASPRLAGFAARSAEADPGSALAAALRQAARLGQGSP